MRLMNAFNIYCMFSVLFGFLKTNATKPLPLCFFFLKNSHFCHQYYGVAIFLSFIVHSYNTSDACTATGGPYEDFPGVVHLSFVMK